MLGDRPNSPVPLPVPVTGNMASPRALGGPYASPTSSGTGSGRLPGQALPSPKMAFEDRVTGQTSSTMSRTHPTLPNTHTMGSTVSVRDVHTISGFSRPSNVICESFGSQGDLGTQQRIPPKRTRRTSNSQEESGKEDSRDSLYALAKDKEESTDDRAGDSGISGSKEEVKERAGSIKDMERERFMGTGMGGRSASGSGVPGSEHGRRRSQGLSGVGSKGTSSIHAWYINTNNHGSKLMLGLSPFGLALAVLIVLYMMYAVGQLHEEDSFSSAAKNVRLLVDQQADTIRFTQQAVNRTQNNVLIGQISARHTQLFAGMGVEQKRILFAPAGEQGFMSQAMNFNDIVGLTDSALHYNHALENVLQDGKNFLGTADFSIGSRTGHRMADVASIQLLMAQATGLSFTDICMSVANLPNLTAFERDKMITCSYEASASRQKSELYYQGLHNVATGTSGAKDVLEHVKQMVVRWTMGIEDGADSQGVGATIMISVVAVLVGVTLGMTIYGAAVLLRTVNHQLTTCEEEIKSRCAIQQSVAHFVPTEFLQLLRYEDVTQVCIGDKVTTDLTMMFTDIRSFTSFATTMTAQETFHWINGFFARMNPVIRCFNGFVDKYMGDGIMAIFRQPSNSVAAAIAMQDQLTELNNERRETDASAWYVRMGIGLHYGEVVVGTIGNQDRLSTTLVSPNVVLAACIESLTKQYGVAILLTESLLMRVVMDDILIRRVGRLNSGGRSYELFDVFEADVWQDREHKRVTLAQWSSALKMYEERKFSEAKESFEHLRDLALEQKFSEAVLEAACNMKIRNCKKMLGSGVPFPEWNGEDDF